MKTSYDSDLAAPLSSFPSCGEVGTVSELLDFTDIQISFFINFATFAAFSLVYTFQMTETLQQQTFAVF